MRFSPIFGTFVRMMGKFNELLVVGKAIAASEKNRIIVVSGPQPRYIFPHRQTQKATTKVRRESERDANRGVSGRLVERENFVARILFGGEAVTGARKVQQTTKSLLLSALLQHASICASLCSHKIVEGDVEYVKKSLDCSFYSLRNVMLLFGGGNAR